MGGKKFNYTLNRDRIIAMANVDCFPVQVYFKQSPNYANIWTDACAVALENGCIISVNDIAERQNVRKLMTPNSARNVCPNIKIFELSQHYGIPTMIKLTEAMDSILDALKAYFAQTFNMNNAVCIELVATDNTIYMDLTKLIDWVTRHGMIEHFSNRRLLAIDAMVEGGKRSFRLTNRNGMKQCPTKTAAIIIRRLYYYIVEQTGYHVSFGISYNKLLARIASGLNKPKAITILKSKPAIARVFDTYKITDAFNRYGNWISADVTDELNITTLKQLRGYRRLVLRQDFGSDFGAYLWNIARGIDDRKVHRKLMPDTVNASRTYANGLLDLNEIIDAIKDMCQRIKYRMRYDQRRNRRHATVITGLFDTNGDVPYVIPLGIDHYSVNKFYDEIVNKLRPNEIIFMIKMTASFGAVNDDIEPLVNGLRQLSINGGQ